MTASRTAAERELEEIRLAIIQAMGEHVPPKGATARDLVLSVLAVARAQHRHIVAVSRAVREVAAPGTMEAQVTALCAEVRHWRNEASRQTRRLAEINPVEALRTFTKTVEEWKLSRAAQAGLSEALTGESSAVEIELTEHEVLDLVLSGSAFIEVGGPDGTPDVLVKVIDGTGLLAQLQPFVDAETKTIKEAASTEEERPAGRGDGKEDHGSDFGRNRAADSSEPDDEGSGGGVTH